MKSNKMLGLGGIPTASGKTCSACRSRGIFDTCLNFWYMEWNGWSTWFENSIDVFNYQERKQQTVQTKGELVFLNGQTVWLDIK